MARRRRRVPRAQEDGPTASRIPKAAGTVSSEAEILAALLTATPNLRARFFANPTRQAGKSLPPAKFWDYHPSGSAWLPWNWYGSPFRYRREQALLAKAIIKQITGQVQSKDQSQGITASVNTDSVFEEYFAPIVKISQRSFTSVFYLSIAAFIAGICLIGVGTYIAIVPKTGTNSTIVGSIFGGSGAISALGAVYAMATRGIREATLDHARVRLVLTAFATQLGQLRAIIEKPPPQKISDAKQLNEAIGESMKDALNGIPSPVEIAAAQSASDNSATTSRRSSKVLDGKQANKPDKPTSKGNSVAANSKTSPS
jgi:hypothetical protein